MIIPSYKELPVRPLVIITRRGLFRFPAYDNRARSPYNFSSIASGWLADQGAHGRVLFDYLDERTGTSGKMVVGGEGWTLIS